MKGYQSTLLQTIQITKLWKNWRRWKSKSHSIVRKYPNRHNQQKLESESNSDYSKRYLKNHLQKLLFSRLTIWPAKCSTMVEFQKNVNYIMKWFLTPLIRWTFTNISRSFVFWCFFLLNSPINFRNHNFFIRNSGVKEITSWLI